MQISVSFLVDCLEGFIPVLCFFCRCKSTDTVEGRDGYSVVNLLFIVCICVLSINCQLIHVADQKPDSSPSSC